MVKLEGLRLAVHSLLLGIPHKVLLLLLLLELVLELSVLQLELLLAVLLLVLELVLGVELPTADTDGHVHWGAGVYFLRMHVWVASDSD